MSSSIVRPRGGRRLPPSAATRRRGAGVAALPQLPADLPALGVVPPGGSRRAKLLTWLLGAPRNLWDRAIFHKVALIPLLAWVGMGADGLSSSAYGPEESFRVLGAHRYLVPFVALAVVITIAIISAVYSKIIEHFPGGGGGYVVASKLLGPVPGLVSGSALLVDYVLTITVSVAAGGDALFSLMPGWHGAKLFVEILAIVLLSLINLRGVRESVISVAPIFFLFIVSHAILVVISLGLHNGDFARVTWEVADRNVEAAHTLGMAGMFFILVKAYSMGAGTFTGIEAVSNGVSILREPKVESGKRTMVYMAVSLALVSSALLISYLYADIRPVEGQTLNATLAEDAFVRGFTRFHLTGRFLLWITLMSETGLLFIAAQTGFIDGPRVMSNMALDGWLPRRFSLLSQQLTMQNGVLLFGAGAIGALLYTRGDTFILVVMYSINVFITFSLSMLSMIVLCWRERGRQANWRSELAMHAVGLVLCAGILALMIKEKFMLGGWVTLVTTTVLALVCLWSRGYYRTVRARLARLDAQLLAIPIKSRPTTRPVDPAAPTAIVLVERFSGIGIHAIFSILKSFPGTFKNIVFVSVGIVDSGSFKGVEALEDLRAHVEEDLQRYVELARKLGLPATYEMAVGTDVVGAASGLCLDVAKRFSNAVVFGAKLIFQRERWHHALMHNQTAEAIQTRLQWAGLTMTIMPIRVFG